MKQFLKKIELKPHHKKLVEITSDVNLFLNESDIQEGLINLSILHTTASLMIQENDDDNVLYDLEKFFNKLVPMNSNYRHSYEGEDDMPGHIKSTLMNSNLTLSVIKSKLQLGNWQGIFLFSRKPVLNSQKLHPPLPQLNFLNF